MSDFEDLKALFGRRLLAAVIRDLRGRETRSEYEEELHRQRKLLDVILIPEIKLHRADVQQLLVKQENLQIKTEEPSEPQPEDSEDDWKKTAEDLSAENTVENIKNERQKSNNCSWCGKTLDTKQNLTQHMTRHRDKVYSCSVCDPRFSLYNQRQKQTEEKREAETGADGEDCRGADPARNSDPGRHLQPDTGIKTEDLSGAETDDSDDWKKTAEDLSAVNAVEGIKNERQKLCKKSNDSSWCGKTLDTKQNLTQRMTRHRDKVYSCSVCDPRFSLYNQRQKQTEEKREAETGADGEDCGGAKPARNSDLGRHLQPETGIKTEDSVSVSVSETETDDSDDWWETREHQAGLKHINKNVNKRKKKEQSLHSCSECGQTFTRKRNMSKHMRIHTGEKPFSCSVCNKRFKRKDGLTRHMLIHKEEKPFSCSVCDKRFPCNTILTRHMIIHSGERAFSCSECGSRFYDKGNLTKHMCIHMGRKQNDSLCCSECGKTFTVKRDLTRHIRIHTGEKPFSCSQCGKSFNRELTLTRHMMIHSGEKPFSCSVCSTSFTRKFTLHLHMARHVRAGVNPRQMLVHTEGIPSNNAETSQC
ncbi:gastrula zinc finger protein XlCGF26.1-like [Cheilinus undulatus]|uniref:gastrula zinc finger protein XlCGF26.1-like n=1 Tax=Cheilinus undulatus TaxID=241271 RepID=UPI001BD54400|nr:gastrula zinc finger protein XlCGF26.1-like [Cheilinus undulatus]